MAVVRHLGFSKLEILTAHALRKAKMGHHAKLCADRSRRCIDMAVFDFSRWWPSAILDFQKLGILIVHTLRKAKMRHHAKFCADRLNRCGDMADLNFFKMAAVRYLGFAVRLLGPPTKCILVVSVIVQNLV